MSDQNDLPKENKPAKGRGWPDLIWIFPLILLFFALMTLTGESFRENYSKTFTTKKKLDPAKIESKLEKVFKQSIWNRYAFIDLNGLMLKLCHTKSMYQDNNVLAGSNGYLIGSYKETDTDYETKEVCDFADYLSDRGIGFLYVNEPLKYLDDEVVFQEFGIESYGNRNADRLLGRLSEKGIDTLDLREEIRKAGIDSYELFYRTDHHWTVPAGIWASGLIADRMNEKHGFHIDKSIFDLDNWQLTEYKKSWLGEQGRLIGRTYTGLEDFVLAEPEFETRLTYSRGKRKPKSGDFMVIQDTSRLTADISCYECDSWHYTYLPAGISQTKIVNDKVKEGKVLFLGDSYGQVTVPFLALGFHETDSRIMRNTGKSVREIVEEGDYDMVVMAYAPVMIGAHDDRKNANYRMYDLE